MTAFKNFFLSIRSILPFLCATHMTIKTIYNYNLYQIIIPNHLSHLSMSFSLLDTHDSFSNIYEKKLLYMSIRLSLFLRISISISISINLGIYLDASRPFPGRHAS